jgi:hypothetical protein
VEREANLDELLAEPVVVALMSRDGVDPETARRLFAGLRERRRRSASFETAAEVSPEEPPLAAASRRAASPR